MARALIDSRLFGVLADFYPSTVTIQEATEGQGSYGEETLSWADKTGHVDLSCRLAPSGGREVKKADQTYVVATHVIAIAGSYPTIAEKDRAVIEGQNYDILLVENDGQERSTRLMVEVVS